MFVHVHVETYTAARIGARTKHVQCEQCGTTYEYRCIRRAVGTGSATYGIGKERAQRKAAERAERLLERRLLKGIDPVPCPACGWVQREMVDELNRRRYRWMSWVGWTVVGLALAAAGCALLVNLQESSWNRVSPGTQRFVTDALIVALAAAGLPLAVRRALQVNPNSAHPDHADVLPGAPRGFPPGVLASQPVVSHPPHFSRNGWVTVQLLGLTHPLICCDCGTPTATEQKFGLGSRKAEMTVRICNGCHRRYKRRRAWGALLATLGGAAAAAGLTFMLVKDDTDRLAATIGAGVGGALVVALSAGLIIYRFLRPVRARGYSAVFNTVRLKFRNPAYGPALAGADLQG
jgi:hypothetical protein